VERQASPRRERSAATEGPGGGPAKRTAGLGAPSRPKAEKAARDAGKAGEATRPALGTPRSTLGTSSVDRGARSTDSGKPERKGATGQQDGPPPATEVTADLSRREPEGPLELVRATSKLSIEFQRLGKEDAERLRSALFEARRRCALGANVLTRRLWRIDGDALDAFLEQSGGIMPRSKLDWPAPVVNGYETIWRLVPLLNRGIASAVSSAATVKWAQDRWPALILQEKRPPHYCETMPIPLRAADVRFEYTEEEGGVLRIYCSLSSGRHDGGLEWRIPLRVRDGYQKRLAAAIADGSIRHGSVIIKQDPKRRMRWNVQIAYKRRVAPETGVLTATLNRGMRYFLVSVTSTGEEWRIEGNDIEAHLKQIQHRRQCYQRDSRASGRRGRGRSHILRPIRHLIERGERWRATKCQTIARAYARWCYDRGIALVYLEDFTAIRRGEPERLKGGEHVWKRIQEWPYYELQSRIVSCLEEYGIRAVQLPAEYISQRCPICGYVDESNRNLRRWQLACTNPDRPDCRYRRHLDVAACANLFFKASSTPKDKQKELTFDSARKAAKRRLRRSSRRRPRPQ
jgi:hypothetical protein